MLCFCQPFGAASSSRANPSRHKSESPLSYNKTRDTDATTKIDSKGYILRQEIVRSLSNCSGAGCRSCARTTHKGNASAARKRVGSVWSVRVYLGNKRENVKRGGG